MLTPAEWAAAHGVRHGMSDRTIARLRGLTRDAVKYHVANIKAKLGLTNRAELRRWQGIPANSAIGDIEGAMWNG